MKAKDLMIGDKLKTVFSKKVVKVKEIRQSCIYTENNGYEYNEVEPIPLTTEILEKNGFYYGYTSNEEDIANNTIAQLSEEEKGWVWDEGAGSVKVIFPNESDGGEIQICDQGFDRNIAFGFSENIMLHELQHALRLAGVEMEIEL